MENLKFLEVRRTSPRFQLIRRNIERLSPDGVYRFVGACDSSTPNVWEATRAELEETFAQAMSTPSYQDRGLYHQRVWPKADPYRIA